MSLVSFASSRGTVDFVYRVGLLSGGATNYIPLRSGRSLQVVTTPDPDSGRSCGRAEVGKIQILHHDGGCGLEDRMRHLARGSCSSRRSVASDGGG